MSSPYLKLGSTVGILGGGQLGRMISMACSELGYRSLIYCPEGDNPAVEVSSEKIIGEEGKPSIGKLNITNLENSPNLFLHNMINLDNNYLKIYKAKN